MIHHLPLATVSFTTCPSPHGSCARRAARNHAGAGGGMAGGADGEFHAFGVFDNRKSMESTLCLLYFSWLMLIIISQLLAVNDECLIIDCKLLCAGVEGLGLRISFLNISWLFMIILAQVFWWYFDGIHTASIDKGILLLHGCWYIIYLCTHHYQYHWLVIIFMQPVNYRLWWFIATDAWWLADSDWLMNG